MHSIFSLVLFVFTIQLISAAPENDPNFNTAKVISTTKVLELSDLYSHLTAKRPIKASRSVSKVRGMALKVLVRAFTSATLPGTYVGEAKTGCPTSLTFGEAMTESGTLDSGLAFESYPVSAISYNGEQCTGKGIGLLNGKDIAKPGGAIEKLTTQTQVLAILNPEAVPCGSFTYGAGLGFAIFDEKPVTIGEGVELPPNTKLIIYRESDGGSCTSQALLGSPGVGSTGGGSTGGNSTDGSTSGGSTSGESTSGGSTTGASTTGASTDGSTSGGSTSDGSTSGESTSDGTTSGDSSSGDSTSGGSTGGSTSGDSSDGTSEAGGTSGGVGATGPTTQSNPATNETAESKCFTADSEVELQNGDKIRMDRLEIGQRVRVGSNEFSEVFLFTHRDPDYIGEFYKITTEDKNALTLTGGHYLYRNDQLAPARSVNIGDYLSNKNSKVKVTKVEKMSGRGLYNPQTLHGDIVVKGIVTSTFTEAVRPPLARMLLKPLEALYRIGMINEGSASGMFKCGVELSPKGPSTCVY